LTSREDSRSPVRLVHEIGINADPFGRRSFMSDELRDEDVEAHKRHSRSAADDIESDEGDEVEAHKRHSRSAMEGPGSETESDDVEAHKRHSRAANEGPSSEEESDDFEAHRRRA
jgi:hypothetical protein